VVTDEHSPDGETAYRAQGYPFLVSSGPRSATSRVEIMTAPLVGNEGRITVVDCPGFGDKRPDLEFTDGGVCSCVAEALMDPTSRYPLDGEVSAVLLFVSNAVRETSDLARQLLALQLSFGQSVWRRVLFVFQASAEIGDTMEDVRRCAEVVKPTLAKLAGEEIAGRVAPVILKRSDSCDTVKRKVLWALRASQIDHSTTSKLTYGSARCTICGCPHDVKAVEALATRMGCSEAGSEYARSLLTCHPRFVRPELDGVTRVANATVFGLLSPVSVPVSLLGSVFGWLLLDSWRDSGSPGSHSLREWVQFAPSAVAQVFAGRGLDYEQCVNCGRSRYSVGCMDVKEGGVQHVFH
jgi:hypothetical protein